ncbi:MAG: hypothetical protein Q9221_002824 [Calogaya cf. arnoldii]
MVATRQSLRALHTNGKTTREPIRQPREVGMSRELLALGLILRPITKDLGTLLSSAGGRYGLRLRDQFHKAVRPVGVTKSRPKGRSSGVAKSKKGYIGPGYQGMAVGIFEKGVECTICAEVRGRQVSSCTQFKRPESWLMKARHTENQLAVNGKWRRVDCLQCQAKLSKNQVCKLIWREDFER